MPETAYQNVASCISELQKTNTPLPVYLIHGEEYLYRSVFHKLLDALLPDSDRQFNYEEIEGAADNVYALAEALKTFSFLSRRKVIAYTDAKIFYSKADDDKYLEKVRSAYEKSEHRKAAGHMASYLGVQGLAFEDISEQKRNAKLLDKFARHKIDDAMLADIFQYAADHNIDVPTDKDYARFLQDVMEKGFPKATILIITTDQIDKRKSLYKTIKKIGMVLDCSAPKGNRMADKKVQESMMKAVADQILAEAGKTIEPAAYRSIIENTGFDFSNFAGSLKKLVDFSGKDARITTEHTAAVLNRTKEDPIYELTGAVADRNTQQALFYLASLLNANIYPLQILAAMINQMRKLIVLKDFTQSRYGRNWNRRIPFDQFRNRTMADVTAYDQEMQAAAETMEDCLAASSKDGNRKKKINSDLVIAKNPSNAYPVYQSLLKAENFTLAEMTQALDALSTADMRLKSTGIDPKIVLEEAIIRICRKG